MRSATALAVLALTAAPAAGQPVNSSPIVDNFEGYDRGIFPCAAPACEGPGGWGLWFYTYGNGPRPGEIVERPAHSGERAVLMRPYTDIVQRCRLRTGVWDFTTWTWFPPGAVGQGDGAYFILFNESDGVAPEGFAQLILFEGHSGQVKQIGNPAHHLPLVRGEWAPLTLRVDLGQNLASCWYAGQPLFLEQTYAAEAPFEVQCINWYSDGIDGFAWDDFSLLPAPGSCYANCDESTLAPILNVLDFNCFLNKFAAADPWANCDGSTQPPAVNVLDIACFLNRFAAGCP
jgi:hypothetical protein